MITGRELFAFTFNKTPLRMVKTNLVVAESAFLKEPAFYLPLEEARLIYRNSWVGNIIQECSQLLVGDRDYTYAEMKVQYFRPGQVPSHDALWHIDGAVKVDKKYSGLPFATMDLYSRSKLPVYPRMISCFFGTPSKTQYMTHPTTLTVPRLLRSWGELSEIEGFQQAIERDDIHVQSPGEILAFDGFQLHRATPATEAGWRCWFRLTETNTRRLETSPPDETVYDIIT